MKAKPLSHNTLQLSYSTSVLAQQINRKINIRASILSLTWERITVLVNTTLHSRPFRVFSHSSSSLMEFQEHAPDDGHRSALGGVFILHH